MRNYKSSTIEKVREGIYQREMLTIPPRYCREISYEDLEPNDVPVKAYWLNWSTTT